MSLDQRLLAILACPQDKGPLYYLGDGDADGLYNPRLHVRYLVRDGIPVMLAAEAEQVGDDQHASLMQRIASEHLAPTFALPAESGTTDAAAAPLT